MDPTQLPWGELKDTGSLGIIVAGFGAFVYFKLWPQLVEWFNQRNAADEKRFQQFVETINAQRAAHLGSQAERDRLFLTALSQRDAQMTTIMQQFETFADHVTDKLEDLSKRTDQHFMLFEKLTAQIDKLSDRIDQLARDGRLN